MCVNLWLKSLPFLSPPSSSFPIRWVTWLGSCHQQIFQEKCIWTHPHYVWSWLEGCDTMQLCNHPRYMETIYMLRCHIVPQGLVATSRSCPNGLFPSLCYQSWSWCSFMPPTLASYEKHPRESVVLESFIPNFGQRSLCLLHPPLLQNLMVSTLSLFICLHLSLLCYLPLCLLYHSLSPISWGHLVPTIGKPKVPLCLQQLLLYIQVWEEPLLPLMIQKPLWEWFFGSLIRMEDVVFLRSVWLLSRTSGWWDGHSEVDNMEFHFQSYEVDEP